MSGIAIRRQLKNYAELSRLSNLPTCWTNVLVGSVIGAGGLALPWWRVIGTSAAVSLLYAAGMAMNDAVDAQHNRVAAPHRPIPSGRVSLRGAWLFACIAAAAALGVLMPMGWLAAGAGAGLLIAIIGYNLLHKRYAIAVLLMGACRGLIYLTAYAAVLPAINKISPDAFSTVLWLGGTMALYTAGFTFVARKEYQSKIGVRRWLAPLFPVFVAVQVVPVQPEESNWPAVAFVGLIMAYWLGRSVAYIFRPTPKTRWATVTWITSIPLIDAYFLTLLDHPTLAPVAGGLFFVAHVLRPCPTTH